MESSNCDEPLTRKLTMRLPGPVWSVVSRCALVLLMVPAAMLRLPSALMVALLLLISRALPVAFLLASSAPPMAMSPTE